MSRLLKDFALHKYETYIALRNKGINDFSILVDLYDICGTWMRETNKGYYDDVLSLKYREMIDYFTKEVLRHKHLNTDLYAKLKRKFDNIIFKKVDNLMIFENLISEFQHTEYNLTREQLIRENKVNIDWKNGCFGIDVKHW